MKKESIVTKRRKINFYEQCQKKGYDINDAASLIKIKVVAMDCGIDYNSIVDTYNEAKQLYLEDKKEKERRLVDGKLIFTLFTNFSDDHFLKDDIIVKVFLRPDESYYYQVNDSSKIEGTPQISVKNSGTLDYKYVPSKTVFTGASSGGIAMGGFHQTEAYMQERYSKTKKGFLMLSYGNRNYDILRIKLEDAVYSTYKRLFGSYCVDGWIKLWNEKERERLKNLYTVSLDLNDFYSNASIASVFNDSIRFPIKTIEYIYKRLLDIIIQKTPPSDNDLYEEALYLIKNGNTSEEILSAINILDILGDYADAKNILIESRAKYEEILQLEKEKRVIELETQKEQKEKSRKQAIKRFSMALLLFLILFVGVSSFYNYRLHKIFVEKQDEYLPLLKESIEEKQKSWGGKIEQINYSVLIYEKTNSYYRGNVTITIKMNNNANSDDAFDAELSFDSESVIPGYGVTKSVTLPSGDTVHINDVEVNVY